MAAVLPSVDPSAPSPFARVHRLPPEVVTYALRELFRLTGTEARMLVALLKSEMVAHERGDMKDMKVHINHIRNKLKSFEIQIETLRDYGYRLKPSARHAIVDMVMELVASQARENVGCLSETA